MSRKILFKFLICILLLSVSVFYFAACGEPNNQENVQTPNDNIAVESIHLNKTSESIFVDDSLCLIANVLPENATNKNVIWSSQDPSIATVENGIVVGKSKGVVTITAESNNGKTANCIVTVNLKTIEVDSVALNKTSLDMEVGDSVELVASISPSNVTNKSLVWSSQDPSIATVENGVVTAISVGTTTIIIETANNKTAMCVVTVKNAEVLPSAIYLSKSSIEIKEGESFDLSITILPSNATNKSVEWVTLDSSVATVDEGEILAIAEGETTVIVTTSNGLTATCSIKVTSAFVFEEYGSGYALVKYVGKETEVIVPATYKNKPVISIGVRKILSSSLAGVVYEENGFANCQLVEKIVLPETVTSISYGAFYNCCNLEEVNIPNGVNFLGFKMFSGCNSLKKLSISFDLIAELKMLFMQNSSTYLSIPSTLETIAIMGSSVKLSNFSDHSLNNLIISANVTNINLRNYTFDYIEVDEANETYKSIDGSLYSKDGKTLIKSKKMLGDVEILSGVECIGPDAFSGFSITEVTIPNSVISIGEFAFYNCDSLTGIVLPNSITTIGSSAFWYCSSLTSIVVPDSAINITGSVFSSCPIEKATIPASAIDNIPKGALKEVVITSGESIDSSAFSDCSTLTSIVIPNSILTIGESAFENCTSLTNVTIPNKVTSIGSYALKNCYLLTSIMIPSSVSTIADFAFYDCDLLTIYCEASSEPNGWAQDWNDSFCPVVWNCNNNDVASNGCVYAVIDGIRYQIKDGYATIIEQPRNIISVNIPASIIYKENSYTVSEVNDEAFLLCSLLKSITVDENNEYFKSIDGNLFNKSGTKLLRYAAGKTATEFFIPDGVTYIGETAFYNCTSLTKIIIPNSVTYIASYAFRGCSSLIIYCEASSEPDGWWYDWNYFNLPVIWNYKG